jgi:hypothetical protein
VFVDRLGRFKRAWKCGLVLALLLRLAALGIAAATVYYVADYFLAFDELVRHGLRVLLPLGPVIALVPEAVRIAKLGAGDAADRVDRIGGHRRKDVLTAWELLAAGDGTDDAIQAFLARRSVDEALSKLSVLRPRILWPRPLIAARARILGAGMVVALAAVWILGVDALLTIGPRMLWPDRDIPPYSRYRFAVDPASPVVLYGGSAEVSATIGGLPVRDQVWMMTRRAGQKARRVACFQEGGERYAQRIENVTVPVEFCFGVGRARSRWHRVDVQLQPQVVLTRVRVLPPPYTRLPVREFPAGQEDLTGVHGSRVTLTLTSNRPLKDGALDIVRRRSPDGVAQSVAGRLVSERAIAFDWTLEADADVKAMVRDVRGTGTAEPLLLRQRLVPDEPPKVTLTEPPAFCMATPTAVLTAAGRVEDDFGIAQVDWIRAVVGFNDRGITLRQGSIGANYEFESEINLARLGVEAGQVLEFYAEALDNNPRLPGAAASGVACVKVISEDEYAEMIRNREGLEQFMIRYSLAMEAMSRVMESLEELHALLEWGNADAARLGRAVEKVRAAHTAAEEVFGQLARDFAAYDSEKTLKKTAGEILGKLAENKADLAKLREPGPESLAVAAGLLKRMGVEAETVVEMGASAGLAMKLAKVMDGAAQFQAVVRRQEILVRWLKQRYGTKVASADLPYLPGYGEHQAEIAQTLASFCTNVSAGAAALPAEMGEFKAEVGAFLIALEQSGASNHMEQAVNGCRNTDAVRALREAQLALEKLQSLIQTGGGCTNRFAGMCRGSRPDLGPQDMKKTLEQMFKSLCRKRGVGEGAGSGEGFGMDEQGAGTGSEGSSTLGTPVYGPERSSAGAMRSGQMREGDGSEGRGGSGSAGRGAPSVSERLPGVDVPGSPGQAVPIERLPVKYREAIKRYFRSNGEGGGP